MCLIKRICNGKLVNVLALGGTYPFKTNGVQKPCYGLPESTVQIIKDDQVKMAIDWIQVGA